MPITSQLECSAAAAILALSDTTASNDGHRRRQRRQQIQQDGDGVAEGSGSGSGSGVVVAGEYGGNSACDANIRGRYWCANRATPEACRTDSSIGALCSDDCCGIGVDYRPPFCCKTEPRSLAPPHARAAHPRIRERPPAHCHCLPRKSSVLVDLNEDSTAAMEPQLTTVWNGPGGVMAEFARYVSSTVVFFPHRRTLCSLPLSFGICRCRLSGR